MTVKISLMPAFSVALPNMVINRAIFRVRSREILTAEQRPPDTVEWREWSACFRPSVTILLSETVLPGVWLCALDGEGVAGEEGGESEEVPGWRVE